MYFTFGTSVNLTRGLILLFLLFLPPSVSAHAENLSHRKPQAQKPLDPMNRPMDELGVKGKDDTLCSDRWYSCTTYDRQQFDQKYPGRPLNELLRYGEPDWPDRYLPGSRDFLEHQDRLDKE